MEEENIVLKQIEKKKVSEIVDSLFLLNEEKLKNFELLCSEKMWGDFLNSYFIWVAVSDFSSGLFYKLSLVSDVVFFPIEEMFNPEEYKEAKGKILFGILSENKETREKEIQEFQNIGILTFLKREIKQ